jgi:hypothetical protein
MSPVYPPSQQAESLKKKKRVTVATHIPQRVSQRREEPFGGWDLGKVSKVDSFSGQPPPIFPPPPLQALSMWQLMTMS